LLHHDVLEELSKFNSLRGNQSYTSHSLSGIVTSLGSGSAIASISGCHAAASPSSVNILEREGGIQPLITEAYSDDDKRRSHAIEALANLAGKKDRQDDLLSAGYRFFTNFFFIHKVFLCLGEGCAAAYSAEFDRCYAALVSRCYVRVGDRRNADEFDTIQHCACHQ
jgi:hypothetical protein